MALRRVQSDTKPLE
ncbi:hypothetical protein HaLaN_14429, partial [Haematococcus lacustris]